ncbi:tryptophan synthase subunit alpha [Rhodopirellula sp.]|jgi:tryptophan synthase alpha chain|nr:tryptophan synthase subunit alpha [Rhodopirellula sp.]
MSSVDHLFSTLRSNDQKALMPFFTAGDPDIETTADLVRVATESGANLCEIGVPYSDPIADGPVIQASYQRALDAGFKLQSVFEMGGALTQELQTPLVTMVSYSIIYRIGLLEYVKRAKAVGYAGAIVPDLLVEESSELAAVCRGEDFSLIQLVTPTTPQERQVRIAESSSGFLYYVSVTGITGERKSLPENLTESVTWLRGQTDLPICIGFGISGVDTAKQLAPVADGLIVGSAIIRRVSEAGDRENVKTSVSKFIRELRSAIDEA